MKNSFEGYVRAAAATPMVRVADCAYNSEQIAGLMKKASDDEVRLICFPELCITGYTCGDLFLQDTLLRAARAELSRLARESAHFPLIAVVGLPFALGAKLYNAAAFLHGGKVLGFVPKSYIPNYGEFYEARHFSPPPSDVLTARFDGYDVPFGTRLLFSCEEDADFCAAAEICEDLWIPAPPSTFHAMAGATVIANLSASDEVIGKAPYRRSLVTNQSGRLVCAYLYADAGCGESSTDMVFSGHDLICENGAVLSESPPFKEGWAAADIDVRALAYERRRMNTWSAVPAGYEVVKFSLDAPPSRLRRYIDPHPFVPRDEREKNERCEVILETQTAGLKKRLVHASAKTAVIGVSGGLDSSLALLVAGRAMKELDRPPSDVTAVTMPCFGTTERTKSNAHALCDALSVPCMEIDISDAVRAHLKDIGRGEDVRDVVYENAQARVRTLVLMDIANRKGGFVVGTGDLSELALGWATYNGDHMSMYGVNAGVPKTLVRHIVKYAADSSPSLSKVLSDVLDTPVSPELLPSADGGIGQKTENIIGPYELHDFFLYHAVRWGRPPSRVLALAEAAFGGIYAGDVVLKWLEVFYRRFFAQQFKRSCMPDGPKIGSVSLSPRGDWRMPSDAAAFAWLNELGALKTEREPR